MSHETFDEKWIYLIDKRCKFCNGSMRCTGYDNSGRYWVCDDCHAMAKKCPLDSEIYWTKYGEVEE